MPIFGESASPYDEFVEKVTAETLTSENWELMINICDRVNLDPKGPKNCLLSVKKRLNHRDPHVVLLALSLLDCLWSNCGQKFRREVSSKEFISELSYKCTNVKQTPRGAKTKSKTNFKSNRVVAEKARALIKKWVEDECKKDNSLSLVESLYKDLMDQGYSFEADPSLANKKKAMASSDPNVVANDQEEADIAKAIALSLQESGTKKQQSSQNANSAYPSLRNAEPSQNNSFSPNLMAPATPQNQSQSAKQVRALYDFEAVEDNEISFVTGDIIAITDDSDQNWWRGTTSRGICGLFPASFVTTDLKDPMPQIETQMSTQNDEKTTEIDAENGGRNGAKVQIDENVLLKCIELIEGLDPAMDGSTDPPELAFLENMAMAQTPLIDQKLMQIDKQLSQLAEVDLAIRDVLGAYDSAVQQVAGASSSAQNVANAAHQPSPQPALHQSAQPPPSIPQMAQIQGGGPSPQSQSQIGAGTENGGAPQWQ